ncbi:MAG: hypothetical protein OXH56_06695 [Gemmatimonadetes bacterium]|nr:hypothetical protein [Gemmatimonadota bacterium]
MKHYMHPERMDILEQLAGKMDDRGEKIQVPTVCMTLATVDELTADPDEVTCPECRAVLRESGLTER